MGFCKINRQTGAVGLSLELVGGWCPVMFWWRPGYVMLVSWCWFLGHVLMFILLWCPGYGLMMYRSCDGVPVMFWWCLGYVLMGSRSCDGDAVMFWWCPSHVGMVSRSYFDGALAILWWCPGYVMMVSKEEMVDMLKIAIISRFIFLSRFISCYWGL